MEIPSSSSSSKKTGDFAKKFEPSNFWCFKEKGALPRAVDQFAKFFGVSRGCSCKEDFSLRRMHMCERRFGPLKQEAVERCKQCLSAKIRASQREESDGAEQDMLDSKYPPIHDALYVKKASVLSLTFREIKATGRKIQDFFRSPPYRSSDQTFDYTDAPKVTCKNVVPHTSSVFPTEKSGFFGFKKKRSIGVGAILNVIDSDLKPMKSLDKYMIHQIISLEDYRPYFTYWITSVQFFILLISLFLYSFAPISFGTVQVESFVLKPSLALEHVGYVEPGNLWIGPASAKLILLGAKYTPCMRGDKRISRLLNAAKAKENESACCIRNDGAGCIQTSREDCSSFMSTWHSWSHDLGDHDALYKFRSNEFSVGSVCGQHPKFCANPLSNPAKPWPNDLARWPVCKEDFKKGKSFAYPNMNCDLIGRPCCVGIKGECLITTQKYCDFVKGSFHREATLCSQVSCLNEVCGLLPFLDQNTPDQVCYLLNLCTRELMII